MATAKATLTWDKETKNQHRYVDMTGRSPIGNVYLPKWWLPEPRPDTVTVTVVAGKEEE